MGTTENKLRQLKIDGVWLATAFWPAMHGAGHAAVMASGWLGAWALAPGLPVLGGVAMAAVVGSLLAARRARA